MAQEMYSEPEVNEQPKGLSEEQLGELLSDESRSRIYGAALSIVRNPDDAEDVVQEALLRSWRARDRFRGDSEPTTWLHAIVKNTAKTALQSRIRHGYLPLALTDNPEPGESQFPEDERQVTDTTAIENIIADELAEEIKEKAERHLNPTTVIALGLVALGMTHRQIGEQLGLKETTVTVRIHRARNKLLNLLEKE